MIQICGTAIKGDNKQVVDWFAWDEKTSKPQDFAAWAEKVSNGKIKDLMGPLSNLQILYVIWDEKRQGIYTETVAVFMNEYKQIEIK